MDNFKGMEGTASPYTIFTGGKRVFLIVLLSVSALWSPISNSIYFPALPTLKRDYHVSQELMNVTMIVYLVFQGVTPAIVSGFADSIGRRPLIMLSLLIYIGVCIGISQTNVFWLLTVLRCFQAAGVAPLIAITSGVSGDVCTPENRGTFVGIVSGMFMVGNSFGSLIGAALISRWGWRGIFVFLAIGSGATLIVVALCLPETARNIVGNGSIVPPRRNRAPVLALPSFQRVLVNDFQTKTAPINIDVLAPFKMLLTPQVIACLVPGGMMFATFTMVLASLSTTLEAPPYNYSVLHVGLMYVPQGVCSLIASMFTGQVLNAYYNFRRKAYEEAYLPEERRYNPFNTVRVRLDLCVVPAAVSIVGVVLFGWMLGSVHSVPAAIVGTALVSFGASAFISIATTMLVDFNPGRGLASASTINLVRCLLGAAGIAALDKMIQAMGMGWCFTLMALLCLASMGLLVYLVLEHGKLLRRKADALLQEKIAAEETQR